MMAELGLQSYRFSISWSRVLPEGRGKVNADGIAWYSRLVDLLLSHDIVPCPTLFHWDLPSALEQIGGFRNRDTANWFSDYAALMVNELGDRVSMWATFNEPWCYAYLGHAAGIHAPGLHDDRAAVTVAHHELLAHGLGVAGDAGRAQRPPTRDRDQPQPGQVRGVAGGVRATRSAASTAIHNRWWFDAAADGRLPHRHPRRLRTARRRDPAGRQRADRPADRLDRHQLLLRPARPRHSGPDDNPTRKLPHRHRRHRVAGRAASTPTWDGRSPPMGSPSCWCA